MAPRAVRVGAALVAGAVWIACIQDDGTRFNPIDAVVPDLSDDDERELGMEFDRELQKHVEVIHDPIVAGFLNDLGQAVVKQIEPQPFIYRFRVIDDPSLNAFAVPGGYIYFHSGTLLAVSGIDELAGVMGHEIAHVKGHHYERMKNKTQIPDLLVGMAGIAAAAASGEPALLVVTQAVNVAVNLSYSREFESEADRLGAVFVTRAGYDPAGIVRFLDRIMAQQERRPTEIPPYLFSHPEAGDRIEAIEIEAEALRVTREPDPDLRRALHVAQARLALLIDTDRQSLPSMVEIAEPGATDSLLTEADALAEAGEIDLALMVLVRAQRIGPNDPRVSFRTGELLQQQGRHAGAAVAYRRTVRLDPSRALVFFNLGLAYKEMGERHRAVFAFEQAAMRAGGGSKLQRRAEWENEKLTFTIVPEAGFSDALDDDGAPASNRPSTHVVREGAAKLGYWARLNPRFVPYIGDMTARWLDPHGNAIQDEPVIARRKPYIGSDLTFDSAGAGPPGTWIVEMRLKGDLIDRRELTVAPAEL